MTGPEFRTFLEHRYRGRTWYAEAAKEIGVDRGTIYRQIKMPQIQGVWLAWVAKCLEIETIREGYRRRSRRYLRRLRGEPESGAEITRAAKLGDVRRQEGKRALQRAIPSEAPTAHPLEDWNTPGPGR